MEFCFELEGQRFFKGGGKMRVLLSPAGLAVTAIIGVVIVIANLIDVLTPDKEGK